LVGLAALPLGWTGCSGVNTSQSVSPLDFLMPGLGHFIKADPAQTNAPAILPPDSVEVATAR
jgi:hypothetical protein